MKSFFAKNPWLGLLLLFTMGVLLRSGCSAQMAPMAGSSGPIAPGTPLPMLQVAGWLNTNAPPTEKGLRGRVLVVDCWTTWCPPCRAEMPHLAEIAAQYQPLGVAFLGLTPESASDKAKIEQFIQTVPGFVWPVGYEAGLPIQQLGVPGFPTLIVFGTDGRVRWSAHTGEGLTEALDAALAGKR